RFERFIFKDSDKTLRFGTRDNNIELHSVDWKHSKTRDSIILKLLHKKGNVSENIFDLLGVRIVTKHLCDVMVALKYLRDFHIITFVNCTPSRARNSLIDVDNFKYNVEMLHQMHKEERINLDEFSILMQYVVSPMEAGGPVPPINPHTSSQYRSLQLTCRQLVHRPDPYIEWRNKLLEIIKSLDLSPKSRQVIKEMLMLSQYRRSGADKTKNNFFPFEVHILDEATAMQNRTGDANHERYKKAQIRTARKRILFKVFSLRHPNQKSFS
ncbi:MAG: TIGR04552 family protein, partial [Oligoflexales bacterium]|nr:TIGR04552 family protein [Oligoflexales bacterium]